MTRTSTKYYRLYDLLEFTVTAITSIASCVTLYQFINHDTAKGIVFSFLSIISILILAFLKIRKVQGMALSTLHKYSYNISTFMEISKKAFYELDQLTQDSLSYDSLKNHFDNYAKTTVDLLADALTTSVGENVSVSIKLLDNESYVNVVCRSSHSNPNRDKDARYKISDSSELSLIVEQDWNHFAASDLRPHLASLETLSGQEYRHPNPNWQKYFLARIVVPIRLDRNTKGIAAKGYEYLGFICADAETPNAFRRHDIECECHAKLLKLFADQLFLYMDKFNCIAYGQKIDHVIKIRTESMPRKKVKK